MLSSKPESKIGNLFKGIKQNASLGTWNYNGTDLAGFLAMDEYIKGGVSDVNLSLVLLRFGYMAMVKPLFCAGRPNYISNYHLSKESFGEGIIASMFNKYMDPEMHRYLRYQTMTMNEFDFYRILLTRLLLAMVDKYGSNTGRETVKCNSDYHEDENDYEQVINDIMLRPIGLQGTAIVCGYGITVASIALVLELSVRRLVSLYKRKRTKYLTRQILTYLLYNLIHRFGQLVSTMLKVCHFICRCFTRVFHALTSDKG